MVNVNESPSHSIPLFVYVGVTTIVDISGAVPAVPTKLGIGPVPSNSSNPVDVLSFVQLNSVSPSVLLVLNTTSAVSCPLHTT